MDFYAVLDQAIDLLRRRRRVTYRVLKRQFNMEDLKEELIYGQRLAVDEEGRVLVWTGDSKPASATLLPLPAPRAYTPPHLTDKILTSRQALALAEELGMRPLQAHCHRGLGTLYSHTGQVAAARAELSTAIDLSRSMKMTFWLPAAEAALAHMENR